MFLSSFSESLFQLIVVLFIFVVVLLLTYITTRWMAGYQKAQGVNKNLQIVESLKLTNNKFVALIKAGDDKYFVVACGKDEMTLLGEIDKDSVKEVSSSGNMTSFSDVLQRFKLSESKDEDENTK